jgi:hypothetical protein
MNNLVEPNTLWVNIKDIETSSKLYLLSPVEFDYKDLGKHAYGLIAEEVDKILPEIVIKNEKGECVGIHYHLLIPMMINELIKLNKRDEEICEYIGG